LANRFGEGNDLIAQSIFLDPRFKKQGFGDENKFQATYQSLVGIIKACVSQEFSSSTISVWGKFDALINQLQEMHNPSAATIVELDKYLDKLHITRTNDLLIRWESRKILYPNLYKIMLKRLCILATSVPCERIFSKAEQICNEKRSRLTTKRISQIMVVNSNADLL